MVDEEGCYFRRHMLAVGQRPAFALGRVVKVQSLPSTHGSEGAVEGPAVAVDAAAFTPQAVYGRNAGMERVGFHGATSARGRAPASGARWGASVSSKRMGGETPHTREARQRRNRGAPDGPSSMVNFAAAPSLARRASWSAPAWRMTSLAAGSTPRSIRTRAAAQNGSREPATSTAPSCRAVNVSGPTGSMMIVIVSMVVASFEAQTLDGGQADRR